MSTYCKCFVLFCFVQIHFISLSTFDSIILVFDIQTYIQYLSLSQQNLLWSKRFKFLQWVFIPYYLNLKTITFNAQQFHTITFHAISDFWWINLVLSFKLNLVSNYIMCKTSSSVRLNPKSSLIWFFM